jgi:hypothetical protein
MNNIAEDLQELNRVTSETLDVFDRIKVSQRIDKYRVARAKIYIEGAKALITGRVDDKREITPEVMQKIVNMIIEIANGKRRKFYLELNEDHSGITDIISKTNFELKG